MYGKQKSMNINQQRCDRIDFEFGVWFSADNYYLQYNE
jgi:hypothetical protein